MSFDNVPIPGLGDLTPPPRPRVPDAPVKITARARKSFWAKVRRTESSCWVWTGAVSSEGYGRITWTMPNGKEKTMSTHRFALHLAYGKPLPPGLVGDHGCNTPLCVRVHPDHVRLRSQSDNLAWAVDAKRAAGRQRTVDSTRRRHTSLTQRALLLGDTTEDSDDEPTLFSLGDN